MDVPRAESSLLGLFPQFSVRDGQPAKVSLKGRSSQIDKVGQRAGFWFNLLATVFWRPPAIARLLGYPEKTDRLEQRQAAGKTLGSALLCFVARGVMALWLVAYAL
jgi:hypothetical protein